MYITRGNCTQILQVDAPIHICVRFNIFVFSLFLSSLSMLSLLFRKTKDCPQFFSRSLTKSLRLIFRHGTHYVIVLTT
uniref:Uncharacterized protein n=1 Tax=Arundo donax TaxID=35708 RepID=A0A0A9ECQ3_ARUDO